MAIIRINEFTSAEGKSEALHEFLKSLLPYILNSDGCISCDILKQQDDSSHFIVIEKWQSIACHVNSVAKFPKEKMAAAMPLLGAAPSGRYFEE